MAHSNDGNPVLAVYDFRSKQEYIYRTNYMRQITGASELIAGMYGEFKRLEVPPGKTADGIPAKGGRIRPSRMGEGLFAGSAPNLADGEMGIEVYEGGGNLLVLYRNRAEYVNANRCFSRYVLENAYGLCMITACAEWPDGMGEEGFEQARSAAFRQLDCAKRIARTEMPTNVLPYTLVDRSSFQPIAKRINYGGEERSLSREAVCKEKAFRRKLDEDRASKKRLVPWEIQGKFIDELGTEKGKDSLVAVLYFDGNSIGEKVKSLLDGVDPAEYVPVMRRFSKELHESLVGKTVEAIDEAIGLTPDDARALGTDADVASSEHGCLAVNQKGYRVIIDHGDEITVVCNAHAAPIAVDAYFKAIADSGYRACCGMAFCHAHDPFSEVYRIAEECCESGKKANRSMQRKAMEGLEGSAARDAAHRANASYVDFHFCRSGITGTLEQIREVQESAFTARPYMVDGSYDQFLRVGEILDSSKLQRSDIKALSRSILKGDSWYRLEYERLKAKDVNAFSGMSGIESVVGDAALRKRILFDVSSMWDVFDVRFSSREKRADEVNYGA